MKISYESVKSKQIKDLNSKTARYMVYRKFSTPFTYIFVRLGISPASISILNFFVPLIGYYFLVQGSYSNIIIGLLFFVLFNILDCCDGEVARIYNPKAMDPMHKKLEGIYFDAVAHYIYSIALGAGLGIGLYNLYGKTFFITVGVALAILFTFEMAMMEQMKSYFRRGIIDRKLGETEKYAIDRLYERVGGNRWEVGDSFRKIFGFYRFQGLAYSKEFFILIAIFMVLLELMLIKYKVAQFEPLIFFYLLLVIFAKAAGIILFIYRMKKHEYMTNLLEEFQKK
jgi:hypothetical protein